MIFSVDAFFKVLNFIVQGMLVAYIVRKYVIGTIVQYMNQEKNEENALHQQYMMWREKRAGIMQKMKEEEDTFLVMQEKFAIWDRLVTSALLQKKVLCQERQKKIDDCLARKMNAIQHRYIVQSELPEIIAQVTQDLQKKFKDDRALGHTYINKIFDGLQG